MISRNQGALCRGDEGKPALARATSTRHAPEPELRVRLELNELVVIE